MPTTWFYIKGCPFPDECNALRTSASTKKLVWHGKTDEEAVAKCAHHLMHSQLHRKKKRDAYEAAWDGVQFFEASTEDEEEGHDEVGEGAPATPPRPTKRCRSIEIADGDGDNADADDPLATQLARQVEHLADQLEQSYSSTLLVPEALSIADAEAACLKAQSLAQSVAKGFGQVASKLNRARHRLE